jgi:hypothetical protein
MNTAEGIRSEERYRFEAPTEEIKAPRIDLSELLQEGGEMLQEGWNLVWEYPGSKENHEWFLVKWIDGKIQQVIGSGNGRK